MEKLTSQPRLRKAGKITAVETGFEGDDRKPLVMFNGIGHGHHWNTLPDMLDRPVATLDMRNAVGYTNYPWPLHHPVTPRFDMYGMHALAPILRDYSDAAYEAMDTFGYDDVDVMGFSWGGMLATRLALTDRSNKINKLVVAATAPGELLGSMSPEVLSVFSTADRNLSDRDIANFYGGDLRTNPKMLRELGIKHENNMMTYVKQLGAAAITGYEAKDLQYINIPTLVMSGSDDPIIPSGTNALFKKHLPKETSQYHVEHNGGHMFLHTRPEVSAQVINEFLDQ